MPDNLSISISADTSKARAELELLNAKVRDLRSEVRKAGDEANASGGMTPRLAGATRELEIAEAQQKSYRRAANATTAANVEAGMSFAQLGKQVGAFSKAAGFGVGGLKALRLGVGAFIAAFSIRALTDAHDKIKEIVDLSKETGFSTKFIQGFQQLFESTGRSADEANEKIRKFGDAFSQERADRLEVWKKGVFNLTAPTSELGKALEKLGIDAANFKAPEALFKVAQELVKLNDSGKIDEANSLSLKIFGDNFAKLEDQLRQAASSGNIDALIEKLGGLKGELTPEAIENAKQFDIAIRGLNKSWKDLLTTLEGSTIFTWLIGQIEGITKGIGDTVKEIDHLIDLFRQFDEWAQRVRPFGGDPNARFDFGGGGDLPGGASGGMIRGPGTGTSDSILARLSDGEFVMRAAAVRKWGPRFMSALNSMRSPFGYAGGGLVTPRFAAGGMVTARTSDGATINLHFPGGSFAMRGDNAIVAGLTREAQRAGMLAGGRKAGLLQ